MEITKEKLIIVIISLTLILTLGVYFFLYGPLIKKIKIAGSKCRVVEAEALQAREAAEALKTVKIKKKILDEEDLSIAIDEITQQGKLENINFISIIPAAAEQAKITSHKIMPIEIVVESTYRQLATFLGAIDRMKKSLIKIRSFNMKPSKRRSGTSKLNSKLILGVHFKK